jgi:hypothetical protein
MKKISAWKYLLFPLFFIVLLSIYPQINLLLIRGSDWQGSYVVSNYDEVAYSAYVNALINKRPRINDPFLGLDDSDTAPRQESLFSIQFIPPLVTAKIAWLFGLSTSSVFILLLLFTAILSVLAIFWLLYEITNDNLLASVGVLIVLCLGTAVAFQGELRVLTGGNLLVDFFPFLRRYQPGFAFPIFFLFCFLVHRGFTFAKERSLYLYAISAGFTFTILVFSYFYLWTAAAAWLISLSILYLIFRKNLRGNIFKFAGIVGGIGIFALIPYFLMLSNRLTNTDSIQLLTFSRMPDLTVVSTFGLIIAAISAGLIWKKIADLSSDITLFVLSFSLAPLILFNQQILTGRVLQAVHYEIFIANYLVLISLVLLISVIIKHYKTESEVLPFRNILIYAAIFVAFWGVFESFSSTNRNIAAARIGDELIPAVSYIMPFEPATNETKSKIIFSPNTTVSELIPTISPFRPLWNPHTSSAGGVSMSENKQLFYRHLYFSGFSEKDLEAEFRRNTFEVISTLFGSERALPALAYSSSPISKDEFIAELKNYKNFIEGFNLETARLSPISYLIIPAKSEFNPTNLDKWYERDEGKTLGLFKVFRLRLRGFQNL